jgi:hypothetical protein
MRYAPRASTRCRPASETAEARPRQPLGSPLAVPSIAVVDAPNPFPGTVVRLVCSIEDAPAGVTVMLIGSLLGYDEAKPTDEFEIEYRGTLLTVLRREIETV